MTNSTQSHQNDALLRRAHELAKEEREMPKSELLLKSDVDELAACAESHSFIGRVTVTIRALAEALERRIHGDGHRAGCICVKCVWDVYA